MRNDIALQGSEILHASAKETNTGEQDESLSEKYDSVTTEHPTILQTQTTKDTKEQFGQKQQHKEIIIKNQTTVNSYDNTVYHFFHIQQVLKQLISR